MTTNAWPRSEVICERFFRSGSHTPDRENHSRYVHVQVRPGRHLALSGRLKRTRELVAHTLCRTSGRLLELVSSTIVRLHNKSH